MNKKKLDEVRKRLDKLDHKLLSLIKKRTILVEKVIKIKRYKSSSDKSNNQYNFVIGHLQLNRLYLFAKDYNHIHVCCCFNSIH